MQVGVAKAKAEKDVELSTAIARMTKEICNDINLDVNGDTNLDLPPRSAETQVNNSSVRSFNHKVMRIFSDLMSDQD